MKRETLNVHEGAAAIDMAKARNQWFTQAVRNGQIPSVFIVHKNGLERHCRVVPRGKKREKWFQG